ncbi:MAG: hypothetical protein GY833_24070, partial [Aestuariibacter sp.]|nr:hypothetical protein [Aestuariibacter sp.]
YVNADFGYQPTGDSSDIGDTVFVDPDADGVQDPGEPGIPGVTVALLDNSGNVIATTVSDENGNYFFPGLPAGTYTVRVTDTDNVLGELAPVSDADGGNDNQSTTTVDGVADDLDQDFGYAPPSHTPGNGVIGDTVFLDTDSSGTPGPGEGLEGMSVELQDGSCTPGVDCPSTTTDENGNYFFGNLNPAATYDVVVDTSTLPNGGVGLTNAVDPDGGGDSQANVDLNT